MALPHPQTDIALVQGDTFEYALTIQDSNGLAIDVSAWTFSGRVRASPDGADLATISIDTSLADEGIITASVLPILTSVFPSPYVHYHIRATKPDGRVVTLLIGRLLITADVDWS